MDLPQETARRSLDPHRPYKPLDVGEPGVSASVDHMGRLVVVTQGNPGHGAVNLTAASSFPEARRFDPDAVRRYRRRLSARNAASFGLRVVGVPEPDSRTGPADASEGWLIEHAIPLVRLGKSAVSVVTFVPHPDDVGGARGVIQILDRPAPVSLHWNGALRWERAPFPELTETHPLAEFSTTPEFSVTDTEVVIDAPELESAAALSGDFTWTPQAKRRSDRVHVDVPLRDGGRIVALGLGGGPDEAIDAARQLAAGGDSLLHKEVRRWQDRWLGWPETTGLDLVARRGVSYVISCCSVPVGDATCLVTDHRILPLAWTRDGYFMARALLDWQEAGGPNEAVALVRRHLAWLFEVAERPNGWWARSHMVGGQRKDLAFQLDQQLYPLVELADYIEMTGDRDPLVRYGSEIEAALEAIESRKADGADLYSTEESPQDDVLKLPYETSNQILAWYTFERLHRFGFGGGRLGPRAAAVARDVRRHQEIGAGAGRHFAYATDLAGGTIDYHDANDMPMALAPEWGFCAPTDPVWRETVRFAFSSANAGYFAGPRAGLGSLHTPAPWPLGQTQAYLVARATDDSSAADAATQALVDAALWDGSLPEATDARTGLPRSRPWFAWPAAGVASAVLNHETGTSRSTRTASS